MIKYNDAYYCDTKEAAVLLGISEYTVRRLINSDDPEKKIPAIKLPGEKKSYRILFKDIFDYAKKNGKRDTFRENLNKLVVNPDFPASEISSDTSLLSQSTFFPFSLGFAGLAGMATAGAAITGALEASKLEASKKKRKSVASADADFAGTDNVSLPTTAAGMMCGSLLSSGVSTGIASMIAERIANSFLSKVVGRHTDADGNSLKKENAINEYENGINDIIVLALQYLGNQDDLLKQSSKILNLFLKQNEVSLAQNKVSLEALNLNSESPEKKAQKIQLEVIRHALEIQKLKLEYVKAKKDEEQMIKTEHSETNENKEQN